MLCAGGRFGVFDVMRTGDGELAYPLPWASTTDTNAIAPPERTATRSPRRGSIFCRSANAAMLALDHFARQRAQVATGPAPLGIHTLMGERRPDLVRNMSEASQPAGSRPSRSLPERGEVCSGSFASFSRFTSYVRSSPESGGIADIGGRLKSARAQNRCAIARCAGSPTASAVIGGEIVNSGRGALS